MKYFDHAAATTMYPEVRALLQKLVGRDFGNPSSIHSAGRESRAVIDSARLQVSQSLHVSLDEIVFTSGATEAMHLAVVGHWLSLDIEARQKKLLVSPLSHGCVFGALGFLQKHFDVTVDFLPLDSQGFFDVDKLGDFPPQDYSMVIAEHGNSEIGHIQPVQKLWQWSESGINGPKIILDLAASSVTEDISTESLKYNVAVLSGEKIGGISGAGLLIARSGFDVEPLISGSQEWGRRGGTENIMGIAALGLALEIKTQKRFEERAKLLKQNQKWRLELANPLCRSATSPLCLGESSEGYEITTPADNFLPHVLHFLLPEGQVASTFVQQMDLKGICLSAGSACRSGTVTGSRALQTMGYSEDEAKRGVRVSLKA